MVIVPWSADKLMLADCTGYVTVAYDERWWLAYVLDRNEDLDEVEVTFFFIFLVHHHYSATQENRCSVGFCNRHTLYCVSSYSNRKKLSFIRKLQFIVCNEALFKSFQWALPSCDVQFYLMTVFTLNIYSITQSDNHEIFFNIFKLL